MTNKTNTQDTSIESADYTKVADLAVNQDLKHSILILSLVVNLAILTGWIALQVTTQYDAQIASMLFTR